MVLLRRLILCVVVFLIKKSQIKNVRKPAQAKRKPSKRLRVIAPPPTTNQIERGLRADRSTRVIGKMSPYIHCRVNPFMSGTSQGVPDGSNADYVVTDLLASDSITTVTTAGFKIQTLCALPITACIKGLGAAGVNDVTINGVAYAQPNDSATGDGGYYPLGIPAVWKGNFTFSPGDPPTDALAASKIRMIAMGYCLTYTGTASSCAGSAVITPNDWSLTSANVQSTLGAAAANPGDIALEVVGANGTTQTYAARNTGLLQTAGATSSTAFVKDSSVYRLDRKLYIFPKHLSRDFSILPVMPVCPGVGGVAADVDAGVATNLRNLFSGTGLTDNLNSSIFWYDGDWRNFQVVVTGMGTGASYRWDTVVCFESNPALSSAIAAFTLKQSPFNPTEIAIANGFVNASTPGMPVMTETGRQSQRYPRRK